MTSKWFCGFTILLSIGRLVAELVSNCLPHMSGSWLNTLSLLHEGSSFRRPAGACSHGCLRALSIRKQDFQSHLLVSYLLMSIDWSKSNGQLRFRVWGNRFHFLTGGAATSHCKGMNAGRERFVIILTICPRAADPPGCTKCGSPNNDMSSFLGPLLPPVFATSAPGVLLASLHLLIVSVFSVLGLCFPSYLQLHLPSVF